MNLNVHIEMALRSIARYIDEARMEYYSEKVQECAGDQKKLFEIIKSLFDSLKDLADAFGDCFMIKIQK